MSLATDPRYLGLPWSGADEQRGIAAFAAHLRRPTVNVHIDREADEPVWLAGVLQRMRAVGELTDGWDGEGARSPTSAALTSALHVLGRFMGRDSTTPAVVPTPEGGVQFEWHDAGWDVQVEIGPSGLADAWGENFARGVTFSGDVGDDELRLAIKEITVHRQAAGP